MLNYKTFREKIEERLLDLVFRTKFSGLMPKAQSIKGKFGKCD